MCPQQIEVLQRCCHDGALTDEPVKVGEVHTPAGVGAVIYSCPRHLPLYQTIERTEQVS
ncbi:hypothetical protein GCM10010331_48770 [Streptomyces xanthochromogenes]|uniref:hypothetical protein n=1 Tax=Streptomyces xanthochromogenes TaxID=67384 RepID=UPI001674A543|nr:hypothetical protein [Streptomyces xanthochromogenes]GHB55208.1 hypothetical protein GCM10010331_48770 [Streptomyces xanthochromogenes]